MAWLIIGVLTKRCPGFVNIHLKIVNASVTVLALKKIHAKLAITKTSIILGIRYAK